MNAKKLFSAITLAHIFVTTLIGCSETSKEADELPDLISEVAFPFIKDSSLYSYIPESGLSEKLATSETGLILALDIDLSAAAENDNNGETLIHTIKPEYFAYANMQTLHIYDLNTRKDHEVFSFKEDTMFDPISQTFTTAPESYICDIQKVVTWDETARLAKHILYKDEFSVYVKTSSGEDCQDTQNIFSYWQINITESSKTFTIRRNTLLKHTHEHTHSHDHDDENYEFADFHGHNHSLEEGELDENGQEFDPNNHSHSHEHEHDFIYGDDHAHELFTKEEVDLIHNDSRYQKVNFETHKILIGNKTTITSLDEALMYTGTPVIDITNRDFGYLGFNETDSAFKFYTVNKVTLEKSLLWALPHSMFSTLKNDFSIASDLDKITPKYNHISNFQYVNKNITIPVDNHLLYFTLTELFDDDEADAREERVNSPLFTSNISSPQLRDRIHYNSVDKKMSITEDKDILLIDFDQTPPSAPKLIKRLNETNLDRIKSAYINNRILIEKSFQTNSTTENSITFIQETGLEDLTVLSKTYDSVSTITHNNEVLINLTSNADESRNANYFANEMITPIIYSESIWTIDNVDYRNNTEIDNPTLLSSESNFIQPNSVYKPLLFLFDLNEPAGQGEDFGYIPQDVFAAKKVVIFSDLYGMIEVVDPDQSTSTYFFTNQKSSFNFDNEFKNMKPLIPEDVE